MSHCKKRPIPSATGPFQAAEQQAAVSIHLILRITCSNGIYILSVIPSVVQVIEGRRAPDVSGGGKAERIQSKLLTLAQPPVVGVQCLRFATTLNAHLSLLTANCSPLNAHLSPLKRPSQFLLPFDGFKQCLEITLAERLRAFALDDFKKHCRS